MGPVARLGASSGETPEAGLDPRTCVITGATAGIGRATAFALARDGFHLGLVCRNRAKGEALCDALRSEAGATDVALFVADLGVQADVRRAAGEILAGFPRLDVLLNNAGVFQTRFEETSDGIETTLAVNHLAYFLLTGLLQERLLASAPARIVSVASDAHRFARLDLDDLEFRSRPFRAMRVYGTSKLLNVMWNAELAQRLEGSGVTANCLHPGGVNTGLGDQNGAILAWVGGLVKRFLRSPDKGAETSVHLASAPRLADVSGRYFADCRERRPSTAARDAAAQARLWNLSEALVSGSA